MTPFYPGNRAGTVFFSSHFNFSIAALSRTKYSLTKINTRIDSIQPLKKKKAKKAWIVLERANISVKFPKNLMDIYGQTKVFPASHSKTRKGTLKVLEESAVKLVGAKKF